MAANKKTSKKKTTKKTRSKKTGGSSATTQPKFPYATTPKSLRRFLALVPQKPRPTKVNFDTLKAWGMKSTNDQSIIRVLKALGLISSNNDPTDRYTEFMKPDAGPAVLATAIRECWAPLFEHSHEPHRDDDETLRNYFHIHSGGSEGTVQFQIQTFKAACDHADFHADAPLASGTAASASPAKPSSARTEAAIHIDLHIHLPENKSRRDYEYIFEDIARYIFGRDVGEHSGDSP